MTKYEKEIYRLITESAEHMTAEQVFSEVKKIYPSVSLATIYNNLNKLNEAGMIRKITVEGSPDRYDRAVKHDHIVCRRCGKLLDVQFRDLTDMLESQMGGNFLFYDLKVYYICPECREKEKHRIYMPSTAARRRPIRPQSSFSSFIRIFFREYQNEQRP